MSFAMQVKDELAREIPATAEERRAEMTALLRMGGQLLMGSGGAGVVFRTHHNATARKTWGYIKEFAADVPQIAVQQMPKLGKKNLYTLTVAPGAEGYRFLSRAGFLPVTEIDDDRLYRSQETRRAYLRGAFLGGGSVNRPQGDYHLEFVAESVAFAQTLLRMLKSFHLEGRIVERKDDYIVYLKTGEAVAELLGIMGASGALLEFENVRVLKDMRNHVNRVVNCETANLQKTVDAALRQVQAIETIAKYRPLHTLPPRLREAAELRLAYPDAPLQELVDELGGITRSGLYHRYRKLLAMAAELAAAAGEESVCDGN